MTTETQEHSQQWYVRQEPTGTCEIVANPDLCHLPQTYWGPFPTAAAAIAKRVGLIRAGKCRPN